MRVLMTGGGTVGHVNPAIAIADTIKKNIPSSEIAFVGTSRGIENKLVGAAGYPIYHVEIQGIRRSLSIKNLRTVYLVLTSPHKAKKLLKSYRPDIVIGTGGYVCWPLLYAAAKMGIPTAVHESNAVPGVAVKQLSKRVDRVFVNFEETAKYLDKTDNVIHVGNPLRGDFGTMDRAAARKKLNIPDSCRHLLLSYGGSLGAERVNEAVLELMRDYSSKRPDLLHIHATGAIERAASLEKFNEMGLCGFENLRLEEYIYNMPVVMAAADLVIARAGAMTVSELSMMKKPCILIPSPNVTNNHQYKNAKLLAEDGAAVLIEESELKDGRLMREVAALLEDASLRGEMSKRIERFALPDANKRILSEILRLVEKKENKDRA